MSKNKSLISIIIFLLLTNIGMLIFFIFLDKPAQKNQYVKDQNGMADMLQSEVGFSKDQVASYLSLRKNQFDKIHPLFEQVRKAKMDFFSLIYIKQAPDSIINNEADSIATKQKLLDLQMLSHFKMVREICTSDQLQKFDSSIKKVIIKMTDRPGRDKHPH